VDVAEQSTVELVPFVLIAGDRALPTGAQVVCKYLEIRPSPDRSPPDPNVEEHSDQGTFAEHMDTVPTTQAVLALPLRLYLYYHSGCTCITTVLSRCPIDTWALYTAADAIYLAGPRIPPPESPVLIRTDSRACGRTQRTPVGRCACCTN